MKGGLDWATLAANVQAFQIAPSGEVYQLNDRHELQRLSPLDRWTLLDAQTQTFQITPNGDLYAINDKYELRRLKLGHTWRTLQAGVQSFTVYTNQTVAAFDSSGQSTLYSSLGPDYVLGPIGEDQTSIARDAPSENAIVRDAISLRCRSSTFPAVRSSPCRTKVQRVLRQGQVSIEPMRLPLPFCRRLRHKSSWRYDTDHLWVQRQNRGQFGCRRARTSPLHSGVRPCPPASRPV